jgi:hypothetical protein
MMAILWILVGGLVSGFSIASQWWFVQRLDAHSKPSVGWIFPVGMFLRFTMTGVLFWLALMQGFLAGAFYVLGLLATRWGILVGVNTWNASLKKGRTS